MDYKKNYAIVLAGGKGSRMESDIPKQYINIDGYPVLYYSLKAFEDFDAVTGVILVTIADDIEYCRREMVNKYNFTKVKTIVAGGMERYDSVCNALDTIIEDNSLHRQGYSCETVFRCLPLPECSCSGYIQGYDKTVG